MLTRKCKQEGNVSRPPKKRKTEHYAVAENKQTEIQYALFSYLLEDLARIVMDYYGFGNITGELVNSIPLHDIQPRHLACITNNRMVIVDEFSELYIFDSTKKIIKRTDKLCFPPIASYGSEIFFRSGETDGFCLSRSNINRLSTIYASDYDFCARDSITADESHVYLFFGKTVIVLSKKNLGSAHWFKVGVDVHPGSRIHVVAGILFILSKNTLVWIDKQSGAVTRQTVLSIPLASSPKSFVVIQNEVFVPYPDRSIKVFSIYDGEHQRSFPYVGLFPRMAYDGERLYVGTNEDGGTIQIFT